MQRPRACSFQQPARNLRSKRENGITEGWMRVGAPGVMERGKRAKWVSAIVTWDFFDDLPVGVCLDFGA